MAESGSKRHRWSERFGQIRLTALLATVLVLAPSTAYANPMIPSCGLYEPFALLLLPFVIFVEARILQRTLDIDAEVAKSISRTMNVESTFVGIGIGIPLAVLALPVAGILFGGAEPGGLFYYVLSIGMIMDDALRSPHRFSVWAGLTTQVLGYFAVAMWAERRHLLKRLPDLDISKAFRSIAICNVTTYAIIWIGSTAWLSAS